MICVMLLFEHGLWSAAVSVPSRASASSSSEERVSLSRRVSERRGDKKRGPRASLRSRHKPPPPARRPARRGLRDGPDSRVPAGARAALPLPPVSGPSRARRRLPAFTCLDAGGQRRLGQRLPGAGQQARPQQPRVALLLRLGGRRLRGREVQEGVPLLGSLGHALSGAGSAPARRGRRPWAAGGDGSGRPGAGACAGALHRGRRRCRPSAAVKGRRGDAGAAAGDRCALGRRPGRRHGSERAGTARPPRGSASHRARRRRRRGGVSVPASASPPAAALGQARRGQGMAEGRGGSGERARSGSAGI